MLSNGQFSAAGAILSDTLTPYGITPTDIAWIGAIFVVFGIVLAGVIGKRLDKYGNYKKTQLTLIVLITSVLSVALWFMFTQKEKIWIEVPMAAFGALQMALVPVTFSYGNELTFPVHPALTQGVMVAATSLSTSIQLLMYNTIYGWCYNDAGGMVDFNDIEKDNLTPEEEKLMENAYWGSQVVTLI